VTVADALQARLSTDAPALGCYTNDPDTVELMAHLGFDWFMIDQMFSANDWSKTELLIRTGEAAGITPVVRVQSNPWLDSYDARIAVDVTRATGLGAKYVFVSHSGIREIEDCVRVAQHWHRKSTFIHAFDSPGEWEEKVADLARQTYIIPHAESRGALNTVEETMRIPEVRIFCFAMTDSSRVITNSNQPDWHAPELWRLIDRALALSEETDTIIAANTGFAYDMNEMVKRTLHLHHKGVRMILIQGASFIFQLAARAFLSDVQEGIVAGPPRGASEHAVVAHARTSQTDDLATATSADDA
jgi:4-hydroxy-2-oxoheptanedioate aldolase